MSAVGPWQGGRRARNLAGAVGAAGLALTLVGGIVGDPRRVLYAYRDVPDGHIYRVMSEGFGLMPSYAAELSIEDRWAIVAYVRALQLSQYATIDQVPPDARRKLEEEGR